MARMLATFAESESDLLKERIREGLAQARSEGKCLGTGRLITPDVAASVVTAYRDLAGSAVTRPRLRARRRAGRRRRSRLLKRHLCRGRDDAVTGG